jgi:capsule biosynthesis phosphatase
MKRLVIDLDDTICTTEDRDYANAKPNEHVIKQINEYSSDGFAICIYTSRNMRTYEANIGKMNVHTLPVIIDWLKKYGVCYDEIIIGKPWCGEDGFYVDNRAIRPSEFIKMNLHEINLLLAEESGK